MKLTRKRLMEVAGLRSPLNEVGMDDPKFKEKAAELLDAMQIDMVDNYEGDFENWQESGMSQPNAEIGELLDKLVAMSSDGEVDKWLSDVAYPELKDKTSDSEMDIQQALEDALDDAFYQDKFDYDIESSEFKQWARDSKLTPEELSYVIEYHFDKEGTISLDDIGQRKAAEVAKKLKGMGIDMDDL